MATCEGFLSYLRKWTRLGANVKQNITTFLNQPVNMDATTMKFIPKNVFTMLEPNFTAEMYPTMAADVKKVLCKNLNTQDCVIRRTILDDIQCQSILMTTGEAPSEEDIDSFLDIKDFANWNRDTWTIAFNYTIKKLRRRHFEVIPIDVVIDNMRMLSKSCGNFSRQTINIITRRILNNVESMSSIPASMNDELMDLLQQCGADPRQFKSIYDDSTILSTMDVSKTSARNAMKFIEDIPTFDPSKLTSDQIPRLVNAMNRRQLNRLNTTEMEHSLCNLCQTFGSLEKGKKKVVTKVFRRKLPVLTNPESMNTTTAECMKCMIPYLPASEFKHIPASVMEEMVSGNVLQQMDITNRQQARAVMSLTRSMYNRTDGRYTSANLRQMGPRVCLKALNATDFEAIPEASYDEDFFNSLDESLRQDESVGTKAVMIKLKRKFKSQLGMKKLLQSKFAHVISPSDIESMPSSDILDVISSESALEVSAKQSRNLMKRIKEERTSSEFDLQTIQNLGPVTCGFTISDIENFPQDSSFVDILNAIANNECPGQIRELHRLRKAFMGFDSIPATTLKADTTSASISAISPQLLLMHSKDELSKYGTHVCTDVVGSFQSVDYTKLLTKAELQDKWKYFLACQGKQTTGIISEDELNMAGNLLCGINEEGISRINGTAIEATIKMMDECTTLGKAERYAALSLYTSVKQINNGMQIKATTLRDLGTLASHLPKDVLDTIPYEILAESAPSSMETIKEKKNSLDVRSKAGFKNDRSADEQETDKKLERYFEEKCATAFEMTADTNSRRKRRSTASLTCTDMQLLGTTGLSALTITQISNLDDQEFIDCTETLGSVTDYTTAQKDALLAVATRGTVWGDPSSWLPTDIYAAGVVCQAMTPEQITTLNLDLDTVSRLGQFDGWDTLKKKAVFDRWLSLHKSADSSTITSSELRSLGHIICGADTSQINNIPVSIYQGAVDSIGELTSCEKSQLQAFVILAKTAYGSDVTAWDSTVITNIGTSIGGLSTGEIGRLTALQIDAIDPNHVTYISDTIFSGFTVSQINTFSPAQAQSTTSTQRSKLTSSQLNALSTVASINWSASDSGVAMVTTTWPVTFTFLSMYYLH
ncbi:uncharacterized protein LOC132551390 [Ylistrum balloti]|uniref:uncharacterized protein LOC132551390 n=1 Tax=Ylistrum balloti TaxID=509963 RepID=UPI002905D5FF|nr:uncharacterized protein LOC132551390 [Ylistrum balloti]